MASVYSLCLTTKRSRLAMRSAVRRPPSGAAERCRRWGFESWSIANNRRILAGCDLGQTTLTRRTIGRGAHEAASSMMATISRSTSWASVSACFSPVAPRRSVGLTVAIDVPSLVV